jgi:hypothetical protein
MRAAATTVTPSCTWISERAASERPSAHYLAVIRTTPVQLAGGSRRIARLSAS